MSPVDGQWYPSNMSIALSRPLNIVKGRLGVHLRLPKSITQWKLQQQVQQQMQEHPELIDVAAEVKDKDTGYTRHALQHQDAPVQSQQELQDELQLLAKSANNLASTDARNQRLLAKMVSSDPGTNGSLKAGVAGGNQQKRQLQRHRDADMRSWHGSMI